MPAERRFDPVGEGAWILVLKSATDIGGKALAIRTNPTETLDGLKEKIGKQVRCSKERLRLVYYGIQLPQNLTLGKYGIRNEAVLHFVQGRSS
jgi:Ubiquitin family